LTENTNRDENAESLDFCPHCGARVLATEPALLATDMGFMSRVKQVDPVLLVLTERGLDVWGLTRNDWILAVEAKEITSAKFIPDRFVTAKLPELPQEAWEVAGPMLKAFDHMLKLRHWRYRISRGMFDEADWTYSLREAQWRGVQVRLHDGREFYFAIEQTKGLFWKSPAWKLSKATSAIMKATQHGR